MSGRDMNRNHFKSAGIVLVASLAAASARAQNNIGDVASGLTTQIGEFGTLFGALAVVVGVAMVLMSGIKFRAYSTNPQDPSASLGGAAGWLIAGAALVAIPELLDVGITSLFGDTAEVGNFQGTNVLN
ncbi:MAG: hypothetical protein OXI01_07020 [Albidovulum sp.]|nr:hypothetical protein [Albidovulum sp.]